MGREDYDMGSKLKKFLSLLLASCLCATLVLNFDSLYQVRAEEKTAKTKTDNTTDTKDNTDTLKSPYIIRVSKKSGIYSKSFKLSIASDGNVKIYYTTDGSNPVSSKSKMLYQSSVKIVDRSKDKNVVSAVDPIKFDAANVRVNSKGTGFESTVKAPSNKKVDKCTVIRAVGVDNNGRYTDVMTNTYFIGSAADHIQGIKSSCKASGKDLAIISLSVNYDDLFDSKTGIYVKGDIYQQALKDYLASGKMLNADTSRRLAANYTQTGKKWERSAHMDYIESDGTTASSELSQNCGIRIQGNYSRSDLQKSFRLYAREDYGKKNFSYPFFGDNLKDDSGKTIKKFKTLVLRNGGNCAFTTKYSDTYWQSLMKDLNCETQNSRPCVVYVNGEYWGLYVLQEDYTQEFFENKHSVNKDDVVLYKGDAEEYEIGYKLDLGELPKDTTDESYYYKELLDFFRTHADLSKDSDYDEFAKLVDVQSARDYFAAQIWINNKWDWPGKNWSMWKTIKTDATNPYADGKWRFCFYDVEFGGVSGASDAYANTIKDDNYKTYGLLDKDTNNPAVLTYAYLMTNEGFRKDFAAKLKDLSNSIFKYNTALSALDVFKNTYGPLYTQFFNRYPNTGSKDNSINGYYASYSCIKDFLKLRADNLQPILNYVDEIYAADQSK